MRPSLETIKDMMGIADTLREPAWFARIDGVVIFSHDVCLRDISADGTYKSLEFEYWLNPADSRGKMYSVEISDIESITLYGGDEE